MDGQDVLVLNYTKPDMFLVYAFTGAAPEGNFEQIVKMPK